MNDSPLFPLLLIGGGVGIDPFVRAPRATRMHPFRDDGGHSDGTVVDEDDAENDVEDQESEDAEQLGDRGKRALAAMKAKLKAE